MTNCTHYIAAEEYKQAPYVDPQAIYSWSALARDVGRLYRYVLCQGVTMEEVPHWQYQAYKDICMDVSQGRIRRSMDFYPHPVWDLQTQALFRVVHDYFHYETHLDFTIEGELALVETHHRKVFSPASYPAIVAEVYGQAAYQLVYGHFGPNKVFVPTMAHKEHIEAVREHERKWDFRSLEANSVFNNWHSWGKGDEICHL